jgi:hypothetical protein
MSIYLVISIILRIFEYYQTLKIKQNGKFKRKKRF